MRSGFLTVLLVVGATSGTAAGDVVRSAFIPLGNCPAKDVVMRVTLARSTYGESHPVGVVAVVRNRSTQTCTYGGNVGRTQIIGPCGAFTLQVFDGAGADIWPGPVPYSCPEIGVVALAPKAQVRAFGSWPKQVVTRGSTSAAPPGAYRLLVDRKVSLTITLR